jgi:hypothetical protein
MALATCRSKVTKQFDCLPSHLMTLKAIPLLGMILTFEEELRSRFLKHVNKKLSFNRSKNWKSTPD